MILFSELTHITGGNAIIYDDMKIVRFSTDSRTLAGHPEEIFIASKGVRDGHDFIQAALEKGVKNFISEKEIDIPNINVLIVPNSIHAFQKIAKYHRAKFDIPIIGITGSNGKTTVKEWLSALLDQKYFVFKSPKSYNSQIGVPLSVVELRRNHEIGIFEAGISKKGEMKNLQKVIQPTIGIFTNLGSAHSDGFISDDEKLEEKLLLFEGSDKVICRSDSDYYHTIERILGERLTSWALDSSGKHQVRWDGGNIRIGESIFKTNFQNISELENATHAIMMAMNVGLPDTIIQNGLNLIKPVPMRMELKKGVDSCYILDDSYNNDLMGLKAALDYLDSHHENKDRTLILSDILHSGRSKDNLYREVKKIIDQKNVTKLIGVGAEISSQAQLFEIETHFFVTTEDLINHFPKFENEMIIVKGARHFGFERVVQMLEDKNHGTILEVNLEALRHNLNQYRNLLKPETKLMAMVKANAYGSGLLEVANFFQHQRVDQLGVAYVDEAIELRKNGITIPIMIMNPHIKSFSQFERFNLQAEIFSISHLKRLLKDTQVPPPIHLKIDTGMHRLGFTSDRIPELLALLKENDKLKIIGIFTHFSSSDAASEDQFTIGQAEIFNEIYDSICKTIGYHPMKHACNSSGIVRWPQYHYDMVRLGIGLHGFDPTNRLKLKKSSELKTVISQIQDLKKGDTVGYSRKGKINKDSRIAVLPIGYEDGYLRVFGNGNGKVNINGSICPTIGNICMDMTMVDVSEINCEEGDEAVLFGANPTIKDLAIWAETIPYEILTNVSSRVKRVFISE